jgi:hypothetical protein
VYRPGESLLKIHETCQKLGVSTVVDGSGGEFCGLFHAAFCISVIDTLCQDSRKILVFATESGTPRLQRGLKGRTHHGF